MDRKLKDNKRENSRLSLWLIDRKEKFMNIGIDIDDTITETSEFLMPYIAKYFSIDIDYLKKNNICYNNLPKEYKEKEVEFGKSTFGKVLLNVKLKQMQKKQ